MRRKKPAQVTSATGPAGPAAELLARLDLDAVDRRARMLVAAGIPDNRQSPCPWPSTRQAAAIPTAELRTGPQWAFALRGQLRVALSGAVTSGRMSREQADQLTDEAAELAQDRRQAAQDRR